MTEAHLFVIGILLAWLAGIRVYLTVFGVGLAGLLGWVDLPPALQATESLWVLGTSAALAVTEFFADKIPGVDSAWDLVQTLARVPAGAFLAAATLSPDGQLGTGALAAGAGVALASHGLKAGTRALLNTSPEPASNWWPPPPRTPWWSGPGPGTPVDRADRGAGLQPGGRAAGVAGLAHLVEGRALAGTQCVAGRSREPGTG